MKISLFKKNTPKHRSNALKWADICAHTRPRTQDTTANSSSISYRSTRGESKKICITTYTHAGGTSFKCARNPSDTHVNLFVLIMWFMHEILEKKYQFSGHWFTTATSVRTRTHWNVFKMKNKKKKKKRTEKKSHNGNAFDTRENKTANTYLTVWHDDSSTWA